MSSWQTGVAGQLSETQMQQHMFVGMPFWMAPAVIKQSACDLKIVAMTQLIQPLLQITFSKFRFYPRRSASAFALQADIWSLGTTAI